MSLNWLKPDWEPGEIVPNLPLQHFLNLGLKALVVDVDETLLPKKETLIAQPTKKWLIEAKKHLSIHLLSNNPSKKRISAVAKQLDLPYTCRAAKPRRKALRIVLNTLDQDPKKVGMIGDRIFTDILVGNRLGLYTVLVKPLKANGFTSKSINLQQLEKKIAKFLRGY